MSSGFLGTGQERDGAHHAPLPFLRRQKGAAQASWSSAFWKRPACDFSALASVSNQSAISSKPSLRAVRAMPGYMSVYSCVSPAIAALRLSPVGPIGLPVAGSPVSSRYSRWPCACPVSPSAVERNTADTSLNPSTSALAAKYKYRRFACDSPAKASFKFFSVLLPFKFTVPSFRLTLPELLTQEDVRPAYHAKSIGSRPHRTADGLGGTDSARPPADVMRGLGQARVRGNHLPERFVAHRELGREPAGLTGIEVQAEEIDFRFQHSPAVGHAQDLEAARTAQAIVTGDYPRGENKNVVESRSLEIVHAGMPHGHAAANGKAAFDR